MKIAIISGASGWHARDLLRAGSDLGLEVECVDFRCLHAQLGYPSKEAPTALGAEGLDLEAADRVLVRAMPGGSLEQVVYRMDALHWLEAAGIPVVNSPRALESAIDKYLSLSRLAAAGLPVPPTSVCERASAALEAFGTLGGDVVTKPLFGSEGRDLRRLDGRSQALEHFGELEAAGALIYQQRFIHHPGWDLRALVVGGEVVGAMKRHSCDGWLTNIARGGRPEASRLSAVERDMALRAARAVGAEIAGVDLLPDRDGGMWVLEVNAVPGWRALSTVCPRDFAADVLRHVAGRTSRRRPRHRLPR